MTPCAVCTVHVEIRSASFLVEPQNQSLRCVSGWPQNHWDGLLCFDLRTGGNGFLQFSLKISGNGFSGLASKLVATIFSGLALKPVATISPGLVLKSVARVSRFGPQNPQLLYRARGASKPRSTVCQWFGLKTTGTVFSSLASKSVKTISPGLASKPIAWVCQFGT